MQKISAGLLIYRFPNKQIEFFLVHPGGPFFAKKDEGFWTIPKGEPNAGESLMNCAVREFLEETGISLSGPLTELKPIVQKAGKKVYAWVMEGDFDPALVKSNSFEIEWPPNSGTRQSYAEVDRAGWFSLETALSKINPAQQALIREASDIISAPL